MLDTRFFVRGTSVFDGLTSDHLVQSFTTVELAQFYADTLNRLWKEGKIK